MKIVIIGSGNVGTVLGRKFKEAGHEIAQVYSRSLDNARVLGKILDCEVTNDPDNLDADAGFYLFALSDSALRSLNEEFYLGNSIAAHTAGSVSREALASISRDYGVFYPLQSLRIGMEQLPEIPLLIDANKEETALILEELAISISKDVRRGGDEQRLKMHVAAVVVGNFSNHLFALADAYCNRNGLDFQLLLPLIKETVERMRFYSPAAMQTGPAVRRENDTIDLHLRTLNEFPALRKLYKELSESIAEYHEQANGLS